MLLLAHLSPFMVTVDITKVLIVLIMHAQVNTTSSNIIILIIMISRKLIDIGP